MGHWAASGLCRRKSRCVRDECPIDERVCESVWPLGDQGDPGRVNGIQFTPVSSSHLTRVTPTIIIAAPAMRPLPLVYHPAYSCPWPAQHRFPMWKFADLHAHLSSIGLANQRSLHTPSEHPPHEWFEAVHEPSYYRDFLNGALGEKAERRIGFGAQMRSPELITRTLLEVSGTVKTVQLALANGLAANLAGGTHHAHRGFGSGFTILNDLAVAAAWARRHAGVERVAIIDLDVHQGDGTASIFEADEKVFTCSMHCGANFPFRKASSDMDIDVPRGTTDDEYLRILADDALPTILGTAKPDLVLYDAGVDAFEGDQVCARRASHALTRKASPARRSALVPSTARPFIAEPCRTMEAGLARRRGVRRRGRAGRLRHWRRVRPRRARSRSTSRARAQGGS